MHHSYGNDTLRMRYAKCNKLHVDDGAVQWGQPRRDRMVDQSDCWRWRCGHRRHPERSTGAAPQQYQSTCCLETARHHQHAAAGFLGWDACCLLGDASLLPPARGPTKRMPGERARDKGPADSSGDPTSASSDSCHHSASSAGGLRAGRRGMLLGGTPCCQGCNGEAAHPSAVTRCDDPTRLRHSINPGS